MNDQPTTGAPLPPLAMQDQPKAATLREASGSLNLLKQERLKDDHVFEWAYCSQWCAAMMMVAGPLGVGLLGVFLAWTVGTRTTIFHVVMGLSCLAAIAVLLVGFSYGLRAVLNHKQAAEPKRMWTAGIFGMVVNLMFLVAPVAGLIAAWFVGLQRRLAADERTSAYRRAAAAARTDGYTAATTRTG